MNVKQYQPRKNFSKTEKDLLVGNL